MKITTNIEEKIPRSLAKSITWRIVITISNFFGGWIASGNPWVGLGVVSFGIVVNSFVYYFHERSWNACDYGRKVVDKES